MTFHDWFLLAPISCAAVLIALRFGRRPAFLAALAIVALFGGAALLAGGPRTLTATCAHLAGALVGLALVDRLKRSPKRDVWLHVGLAVSAVQVAIAAIGVTLWAAQGGASSRVVFLAGASSVAAFALAAGLAPYLDRRMGWITRALFADLAQPFGSPLVSQLQSRAPSTFELSRRASEIAAAAGEVVGADTLAIRAGAMHAEVGRLDCARNAGLVTASQKPSLELSPELECLVEFDHVKDAVAICEDYDLPRPVVQLVAEHHGTLLRRDAFEAARKLRGGDSEALSLSAFRYPGPKPSSRESAAVQTGWYLAEYGAEPQIASELESAVLGGEWAHCGLSAPEHERLLAAALRCARELEGASAAGGAR